MKSLFLNVITLLFCLILSSSILANSYCEHRLARCVLRTYCHQLPPDFAISKCLKMDKSAHRLIYTFLQQNSSKDTRDTVFVLSNSTEYVPAYTYFLYKDSVLEFTEHYSDGSYLSTRRCAYDEVFTCFYRDLLRQWSREVVVLGEKTMSIEVNIFEVARIICKNGKCISLDILRHDDFDGMWSHSIK